MRQRMSLSLPRQPSTVACARGVLDAFLTLTGTTQKCRDELAVIISEACANAVEHSEPGSVVDISVDVEDHECVLEVGNGGDIAGVEIRWPPADPLRIGGRGLLLVAALADTAVFAPAPPGQVLLRVTKHLPTGTPSPRR